VRPAGAPDPQGVRSARTAASRPGTVFTRGQIMARVWHNEVSSSRTVDTHIGTLRAKLGARS